MSIFPLCLSTLVSIIAILATIHQTASAKKTKINALYFEAQLHAYQELFSAAAELERETSDSTRDFSRLIKAGQNAMLVSTNRNADVINDFCAVCIDYITAQDCGTLSENLINEFKKSKFYTTTLLRAELFRFDTMKRKSDKHFH